MKANILTLAITLTVGIILAGSLLMPVISDATETTRSFTNEGYISATPIDPNETYIIEWDPANQYHITVNNVDYDLSDAQTSEYSGFSIAFANDWVLRYNLDRVFICPLDNANAGVVSLATVDNGYTFTGTLAGDTFTTVVNNVTNTYTVDGAGLIISENGEYVLKSATESAYILKSSHVYAAGRTNRAYSSIAGTAFNLYMDATVTGTTSHYAPSAWTVTGETMDFAEVADYVDLYKMTKITAIANDGTNGDTTITYNQVFVPKSITAELSNHLAPGEIAILNALPVLIIVALVMMAAGALYLKRDD